jgi:hypothetical protein
MAQMHESPHWFQHHHRGKPHEFQSGLWGGRKGQAMSGSEARLTALMPTDLKGIEMTTFHSIPDDPEQWRAMPDHEGEFEISSLGRVRALDRVRPHGKTNHTQLHKARMRVTPPNASGYPCIRTHLGNFLVHRLLLRAFVGECPAGQEGAHWDRNPGNCRLSNLRWATPLENYEDKLRHGTSNRGEACNFARLTWDVVGEIRERPRSLSERIRYSENLGVSLDTINRVLEFRTWKIDPIL